MGEELKLLKLMSRMEELKILIYPQKNHQEVYQVGLSPCKNFIRDKGYHFWHEKTRTFYAHHMPEGVVRLMESWCDETESYKREFGSVEECLEGLISGDEMRKMSYGIKARLKTRAVEYADELQKELKEMGINVEIRFKGERH